MPRCDVPSPDRASSRGRRPRPSGSPVRARWRGEGEPRPRAKRGMASRRRASTVRGNARRGEGGWRGEAEASTIPTKVGVGQKIVD